MDVRERSAADTGTLLAERERLIARLAEIDVLLAEPKPSTDAGGYQIAEFATATGTTRYRVERDGRTIPASDGHYYRATAEQELALLVGLPNGYCPGRILRGDEWEWRVSRGKWRTTGTDVDQLIASAADHAERKRAREASAAVITAPETAQTQTVQTPARDDRQCRGCGIHLAPGTGMIASLGLSCDWCYDQLSD